MDPQEINKVMQTLMTNMGGMAQNFGIDNKELETITSTVTNIMKSDSIQNIMRDLQQGQQLDMGNLLKVVGENIPGDTSNVGDLNKLAQTMLSELSPKPPLPTIRENIKETQPTLQNVETEAEDDEEIDLLPVTDSKQFPVNVSLKDLYCGKTKRANIIRKNYRRTSQGNTEVFEEKKKLKICIEPGMKDGDEIVFYGESDRLPNHRPGDIIIVICEMEDPEERFERAGDSLFTCIDINLAQNYRLCTQLTTFDNRVLTIVSDDKSVIHKHNGLRKIPGEGMPIRGTDRKENLYIRFKLVIPDSIDDTQVKALKTIVGEGHTPTTEDTIVKVEHLEDSEVPQTDYFYDDSSDSGSDYSSDYSSNHDSYTNVDDDIEDDSLENLVKDAKNLENGIVPETSAPLDATKETEEPTKDE